MIDSHQERNELLQCPPQHKKKIRLIIEPDVDFTQKRVTPVKQVRVARLQQDRALIRFAFLQADLVHPARTYQSSIHAIPTNNLPHALGSCFMHCFNHILELSRCHDNGIQYSRAEGRSHIHENALGSVPYNRARFCALNNSSPTSLSFQIHIYQRYHSP